MIFMGYITRRHGQSILEVMIAVSILTIAFLGIGALLSRSFVLNRTATNETVASYLAAEGIEVTKNVIDYDMYGYGGSAWGTDVPAGSWSPIYSDNGFCLVVTGPCTRPNAKTLSPLQFDPVAGYQYASGVNTSFVRWITVTWPNANEIDVQSVVQWSTGPVSLGQIVDEEHFYNWYNPK